VQDAEGNPLAYSAGDAEQMLDSNIEFFLFVLKESGKAAIEAKKELAETVGKSLPASSGKKSGAARRKSVD